MSKPAPRWIKWTFALLALVLLGTGGLVWTILSHGISARDQPTAVEVIIARRLRHLAIPSHARAQTNPGAATPEALAAGMAHFADHCATCHANDGSGDTAMGRNLYPKAPDMRLPATQTMSDGELFYIIENGVRLTGMPAWSTGTPDSATDTWNLVHFLRHLPHITEPELEQMRALNPKTPDEFQEEEESRRFLAGEGEEPNKPAPPAHHH
jgi:mono/diheme cytochrome c family protein